MAAVHGHLLAYRVHVHLLSALLWASSGRTETAAASSEHYSRGHSAGDRGASSAAEARARFGRTDSVGVSHLRPHGAPSWALSRRERSAGPPLGGGGVVHQRVVEISGGGRASQHSPGSDGPAVAAAALPAVAADGAAAPAPMRADLASCDSPDDVCTLPPGLAVDTKPEPDRWILGLLRGTSPFSLISWSEYSWFCAHGSLAHDQNGPVKQGLCHALRATLAASPAPSSRAMSLHTHRSGMPGGRRGGAGAPPTLFRGLCLRSLCREGGQAHGPAASVVAANGVAQQLASSEGVPAVRRWVGFPGLGGAPGVVERPELFRAVLREVQGHCVLVGPRHLEDLRRFLRYRRFIEVPCCGDAWLYRKRIEAEMRKTSQAHPDEKIVFLIAAGLTTNLLVNDLFDDVGQKDVMLDVGSSLDLFAGVQSRAYNSGPQALEVFCDLYPRLMPSRLCGSLEPELSEE